MSREPGRIMALDVGGRRIGVALSDTTRVLARLTSVAAERMMIDMGIKPERRKARIDEVAASIILQDFLETRRNL